VNKVDLDEALSVTDTVTSAILTSVKVQSGLIGAQVRYSCGFLSSNGASLLSNDRMGFFLWLIAAFETAQAAGATFEHMDAVRSAAAALTVNGLPARAVRNFSVRMALTEQAKILAATEFKSRQAIDRLFERINASFDDAETVAADNLDNIAYKALITLHAAVSNDLASRSRPLPRMVTYNLPKRFPSLTLAQRLYADASRGGELVDENDPIHPLFMPQKITALSS
jgi:prophage DNA circulation protein